jgi:hypothetical protein
MHHNVLNVRVRDDASRVASLSNFYAEHLGRGPYEGQLYSMWGTYGDTWVQTEHGWRIKLRDYRIAFTRGPKEMLAGPTG